MGGLIVVGIFAVLVITTIFMGVRLVPQGSKWVVQRLGKFHKTLNPGLNIIIPYVDNVAYKVTTKDQVLDILFDYVADNGTTLVAVTHDHDILCRFKRVEDIKGFGVTRAGQ